jgi:hypothetical protein
MPMVFRVLMSTPLDSGCSVVDAAGEWWAARCSTGQGQIRDGVTSVGQWTITLKRSESATGHPAQVTVEDDESGTRTTLQEARLEQKRVVLVEEDTPEGVGPVAMPEPSAATRELAALLLGDHSDDWVPRPQLLLVGGSDRHVGVLEHLGLRTRGMVSPLSVSVEAAAEMTLSATVSDGSVVLLRSEHDQPLVLPAIWVRNNPLQAARRLQRELVGYWTEQRVPSWFRDAQLALRRVGLAVEEWVQFAEELEAHLDRARGERDLALLQQDEALQELDDLQRRLAFLERQFRDRGEVVPYPDDEDEFPSEVKFTMDAMKYAAELLPWLALSPGASDRCGDLDEQHSAPITAKRAWRALRALNDYAQSKYEARTHSNFRDYCRETPAGFLSFPVDDVALTESGPTLERSDLRAARVFRVPSEVSAEEQVLMAAHIKVAGIGNLAARLHFHDDTTGATKKVHVGYLGPHLPLP